MNRLDLSASSTVDLSIIVPVFNNRLVTQSMLESLIATLPQNLSAELIIVDDASTDSTSTWLESLIIDDFGCPQIKSLYLLKNTQNLGYAKSNNLAAKKSKGQILALLNNDLVLKRGWLEPMLAVFSQQPLAMRVVGNLQYGTATGAMDHAGIDVRINPESGRPIIEHRRECATTTPHQVFAVTGACCLLSRATFERVGGLDEGYVNGSEDVDLCLKVRTAGGECWIVPDSDVWHHVSKTRGRHDDRDEKNSWRLFQKWQSQIARELERSCAEIYAKSPHEEPLTKRMAIEFLTGARGLAPIAIKAMAQQVVQAELVRWEKYFHANA
jgi:GT2 family glycosyltransferase